MSPEQRTRHREEIRAQIKAVLGLSDDEFDEVMGRDSDPFLWP